MSASEILLYTSLGVFVLFVLLMGLGGHVMPTGAMVRTPTRTGDVMIALCSFGMVIAILYIIFGGGWKYIAGVAPEKVEEPLFTPVAVENVTTIGFITIESFSQPKELKKTLREYCVKLRENHPATFPSCTVLMWHDGKYTPRRFPIPPGNRAYMSANYVYNPAGNLDRFCWLTNGKLIESQCF